MEYGNEVPAERVENVDNVIEDGMEEDLGQTLCSALCGAAEVVEEGESKMDDAVDGVKEEETKLDDTVNAVRPSRSLLAEAPMQNEDGSELEEEIKKLRQENESLKAQIESKNQEESKEGENVENDEKEKRKKKKKKKRRRKKRRVKEEVVEVKKRRDDIFLAAHPWENPNDVYLRLHEERLQYIERCSLYTVGTGHLRLRIFGFVLLLWMTHILLFCVLLVVPLVCGRWIVDEYLEDKWYIGATNKDFVSYLTGVLLTLMIPNEIYCILTFHMQGTLSSNLKRTFIRSFVFLFIPLYIGYVSEQSS